MNVRIASSTASVTSRLGSSPGRVLLKVGSGPYVGRLAAILGTSPAEIRLSWADPPYRVWSNPSLITNSAADNPHSAVMDNAGNIWVAYTNGISQHMVVRKLTFTGGAWSVGTETVVYSGASAFEPALGWESSGRLWMSFSRYVAPNRFCHVKSSDDGGATWGSGAADAGTQLSDSSLWMNSVVLIGGGRIMVVYRAGNDLLHARWIASGGGSWSAAVTLSSGVTTLGEWDAAVTPDGLVGVLYSGNGGVWYREYDGTNLGSGLQLDTVTHGPLQLLFRGLTPLVLWGVRDYSSTTTLKILDRATGQFSTPTDFDPRQKPFDQVLLYSQQHATYHDGTGAASGITAADLYHPSSLALVKLAGDALYLGMDQPFRLVHAELSTIGIGGTVQYSFWDGHSWKSITPYNGAGQFTGSPVRVALWQDIEHIPLDWQRTSVNGLTQFWVRVLVTAPFSTAPVGTSVLAMSQVDNLKVGR